MFGLIWEKLRSGHTEREPVRYFIKPEDARFLFGRCGDVEPLADVAWTEISEIRAFKRDLFVVDEICLGIGYGKGDYVEVWESDLGYEDFLAALNARLPECARDWWSKVAFPAFATNETVLYKRP